MKSSNNNVGIPGITMIVYRCGNIEYECDHIIGLESSTLTATDADGWYTFDIPSSIFSGENEKQFFICALDPSNKYITECYDGYYFLYSGQSAETRGGDPVTVSRFGDYTRNIDFHLCESGNIIANLNVHDDRGYKVTLEGTVDFKKTHDFPFESEPLHYIDPNYLPDSINFAQDPSVGALPYGTYSVKLEDMHLIHYYSEVFNFSSMVMGADYYPYEIDDIHYYATQYAEIVPGGSQDTQITISASSLSKTVSFRPQAARGTIFGLVTDQTGYNEKSTVINMTVDDDLGESGVGYSKDPNSDANVIGLVLDPNHIAIHNIETEIIPVNNQTLEVAATIPTKILRDPNFNFWIGRHGGYAFKFLEPGGYKIRVFRKLGSIEVFSAYYKGTSTLAYSLGTASTVTIGSGNWSRRADFKLPKVSIYGEVTIAGGGSVEGTIVNLLTSTHEQISFTLADPNKGGSFSFSELVTGDIIVRIAKTGGSGSYNVEKISLDDVRLGNTIDLGTIQLQPYNACSGNGRIYGRVFWDEDPNVGIPNVQVRAQDIEHMDAMGAIGEILCTDRLTDSDGNFEITGLPNSAFIVYTGQNLEDGFFGEMYENITLYPPGYDNIADEEIAELAAEQERIALDPTHVEGTIATLVRLSDGDSKPVNFGLSKHQYELFSGMNLFAYPGIPLNRYKQARTFITRTSFYNFSPYKFMSFISSAESGNGMSWDVIDEYSGDFEMEAGRGYLFYFEGDESDDLKFSFELPPFTTSAVDIKLAGGLNFVSIPDGLEKGWQARHVLSDIQWVGGNVRCISRYQAKAGKWKSMAPMWGRPAGDDFRIKRDEGYLVHMKNQVTWSRD